MRAGRALRENWRDDRRDLAPAPGHDRTKVCRALIEQCGDDPARAAAKAILEGILRDEQTAAALVETGVSRRDAEVMATHVRVQREADVAAGLPACRECGCTENAACVGGCSWAAPDLCSRCAC
jgi:hypothetical protein